MLVAINDWTIIEIPIPDLILDDFERRLRRLHNLRSTGILWRALIPPTDHVCSLAAH